MINRFQSAHFRSNYSPGCTHSPSLLTLIYILRKSLHTYLHSCTPSTLESTFPLFFQIFFVFFSCLLLLKPLLRSTAASLQPFSTLLLRNTNRLQSSPSSFRFFLCSHRFTHLSSIPACMSAGFSSLCMLVYSFR